MIYILNLTKFDFFLSKKFLLMLLPFLISSQYSHLNLNIIFLNNMNHKRIQMINYTTWKKSQKETYIWCKNIFYLCFLWRSKSNIIWWNFGNKYLGWTPLPNQHVFLVLNFPNLTILVGKKMEKNVQIQRKM
jgi:hypothetical protein